MRIYLFFLFFFCLYRCTVEQGQRWWSCWCMTTTFQVCTKTMAIFFTFNENMQNQCTFTLSKPKEIHLLKSPSLVIWFNQIYCYVCYRHDHECYCVVSTVKKDLLIHHCPLLDSSFLIKTNKGKWIISHFTLSLQRQMSKWNLAGVFFLQQIVLPLRFWFVLFKWLYYECAHVARRASWSSDFVVAVDKNW